MKSKVLTIYIIITSIVSTDQFLINNLSHAAEIDSYSGTDKYILPANYFIDHNINQRLREAVKNLNAKKIKCAYNQEDAIEVYSVIKDELIRDISHFYVGHFIAEYFNDIIPTRRKIVIPFDHSIYSDMDIIDGVSLRLKGTLGIIKVNGFFHATGANYIGMDKLGHFFVEGFSFFEKAYLEKDGNIEAAIKWGKETEKGKYGLITTGVFSHADLVANFNGMRFWNQILRLNKDPLERFFYHNKPYMSCRLGKWFLQKDFELDEYTDAAWDEKINCNEYRNEEIRLKVLKGYENAYDADSWEGFCPAIKSRCEDVKEKYLTYSKHLIDKSCLSISH